MLAMSITCLVLVDSSGCGAAVVSCRAKSGFQLLGKTGQVSNFAEELEFVARGLRRRRMTASAFAAV